MKTLFRHCEAPFHGNADGLSLHYYTVPGPWEHKGSATEFDDAEWYKTLAKAYAMDRMIRAHAAVMDQYDPEKKIGMIVDEWGNWFDVEPGTNPGFLYQQNTMRDALVAALTLNIFNKHSDRVRMACIAQMVNVLQSVILTDGPRMVKTPTWHVFNLFKDHQEAQLVDSSIETVRIGETEEFMVPNLTESASIDPEGRLVITVGNLSVTEEYPVDTVITGFEGRKVSAEILQGAMQAKNTFEEPDAVAAKEFAVVQTGEGVAFTIPACSVVRIIVE